MVSFELKKKSYFGFIVLGCSFSLSIFSLNYFVEFTKKQR